MRATIRVGSSQATRDMEKNAVALWESCMCGTEHTGSTSVCIQCPHARHTKCTAHASRAHDIRNRAARAPLLSRFTASTLAANWVVSCRRVTHDTGCAMELTWWCLHVHTPHCSAKRNNARLISHSEMQGPFHTTKFIGGHNVFLRVHRIIQCHIACRACRLKLARDVILNTIGLHQCLEQVLPHDLT